MAAIVFILISLLQTLQLSTQQVDQTLEREASGADVVRATVSKIEPVLGFDNQFLRRIAFVESRDGTGSNTYRRSYDGGIWQVDESAFRDTQNTERYPALRTRYYEKIMSAFRIDWPQVRWSDLRIPLYSGLAARLFLLNIPLPKPCDIAGQAAFWNTHYNSDGTQGRFIDDIQALREAEGILL